ncbi:L,D-transpeptidase [Halonatronum saccharophilum]|uniref:L,D-transpeptidase n=1 Tax=Halonatronum saccharophilum TaxID=150060 RepID=UPI0004AFA466|nr:L,D-transpeptidase [Halonatronum saccharophilum]
MKLISEKKIKKYIFILTIILIFLIVLLFMEFTSTNNNDLESWIFKYELYHDINDYLYNSNKPPDEIIEKNKLNKLRTALLLYINDYNKFPKDLKDLTDAYLYEIPKEPNSNNNNISDKLDYSGGWYYNPLKFNGQDLNKGVQKILKTNTNNSNYNNQFFDPYWVWINTQEQKLYFMEGNKALTSYPIGIGSPETPTPKGTFRIKNKLKIYGEEKNQFGDYWLGIDLWTKGGGYGIHGSPYEDIEVTKQESRGCIRMRNEDVRELYYYLPLQSRVVIK